ncbi:MAG: DUF6702 family protein [Bacteroidota bacterium]
MLLIFILIPLLISPAIDKPLATFELWVEEEVIYMEVKFDKKDLEQAIQKCYDKSFCRELAEAYFTSHSQWLVDEEKIDIQIFHFKVEHNTCSLKARLDLNRKEFKSLEIRNTCLVDQIVNHSNIVFVHHLGKDRAFRLSKRKTQTFITW